MPIMALTVTTRNVKDQKSINKIQYSRPPDYKSFK